MLSLNQKVVDLVLFSKICLVTPQKKPNQSLRNQQLRKLLMGKLFPFRQFLFVVLCENAPSLNWVGATR